MASAANPRKFSEKIAIMERKQTEENRQFDDIMAQVRSLGPRTESAECATTSGGGDGGMGAGPGPGGAHGVASTSQHHQHAYHHHPPPGGGVPMALLPPYHPQMAGPRLPGGGSLPNVHQMVHGAPPLPPSVGINPAGGMEQLANWNAMCGGGGAGEWQPGGGAAAQDSSRVMHHHAAGHHHSPSSSAGAGAMSPCGLRGRSPVRSYHPYDLNAVGAPHRRVSPTASAGSGGGQMLPSARRSDSSPYGGHSPLVSPGGVGVEGGGGPPSYSGGWAAAGGGGHYGGGVMPPMSPYHPNLYHHTTLLQLPGADAQWRRAASDPGITSSLVLPTASTMSGGGFSPASSGRSSDTTHSPTGSTTGESVGGGMPPDGGAGPYAGVNRHASPNSPRGAAQQPHCPAITAALFAYHGHAGVGGGPASDTLGGMSGGVVTPTGSLPNFPTPLLNQQQPSFPPQHASYHQQQGHMAQQQHMAGQQQIPPQQHQQHAGYSVQQHQHQPIQQRHSVQLPVNTPSSSSTAGGVHFGLTQSALAATPPYAGVPASAMDSSQSAPNSPADGVVTGSPAGNAARTTSHTTTTNTAQQRYYDQLPAQMNQFTIEGGGSNGGTGPQPAAWGGGYGQMMPPSYQHATPMDTMVSSPGSNQIPNIILTGADGSISGHHQNPTITENTMPEPDPTLDWSSDIQNLDENELEQLLADNGIDSRMEEALRNDSN